MGGHRYENFRAQMRNLLRLRYEKDGGKDMEIIWRTHVETMRVTTVKMKGGHIGGTDVKLLKGTDMETIVGHSCGNFKGHGSENYGR